jgi:asparagine synthase (glutamine-hydrolysing)
MCGIAGMIDLSGLRRPVEQARVRAMAQAIVHRGPDEDGFFFAPGIGFANRRLSIVGLADGKQPLANEDNTVHSVFNGEFYDYPELKAELEGRGHTFRTHCDTELIPHLWEDYQDNLVDRLKGQFAFAVFDSRNNRVVLARDHFGICPLYWARVRHGDGEWLLFGSEIKAILASGMITPRPDKRGISGFFTFFSMPGPLSCFENIHSLRPGQILDIRLPDNRPAIVDRRSYYDLEYPEQGKERIGSIPDLADEFEKVLYASVERRLRADVPVVSYLSGGVDSGIVVAMASKAMGRPIPSFTIRITDPALDETSRAMETARHVGCDPFVVDFGPNEAMNTYPQLVTAAESPVIDTSCAALLMLSKAVHDRGYKVVLTGEGSDEWLAGYPWHKIHKMTRFMDLLPGMPLSHKLRDAAMILGGGPRYPASQRASIRQSVGGHNGWLDFYGIVGLSKLRLFAPDMLELALDHNPYQDLELPTAKMNTYHPLNRELYLSGRAHLVGLLLNAKGDRIAMHNSVEARYPFLDEQVFRFIADIHPKYKLRRTTEKYLLRVMAERWLPKNIAWRQKAMFRAPFDSLYLENAPPFVEQLLSEESIKKSGYFEHTKVQHWREKYKSLGRFNPARLSVEMGLIGVVSTQLWHHTYINPSLCELPGWQAPKIA